MAKNSVRDYGRVEGIRSSCVPGSDRWNAPDGASRCVRYGDRIFVRVVDQRCWQELASFQMTDAASMSDIYGALRHRAGSRRGLVRIYIRNATRGWAFEQPFRLYGPVRPVPGVSVTRPVQQPERSRYIQPSLFEEEERTASKVPQSIRTYDL